ncbi:MAG: hypothetical protein ABIP68_06970 [Ferruginibacter sp.]
MKIYFSIVFLITSIIAYGQNISGTINNINNEKIISANILFKDSLNGKIKEFTIARNGNFSLLLKKSYHNLIIEITSSGYQIEHINIIKPEAGKEYNFNISLTKDTIVNMENVVVSSKRQPFTINSDTVSYNVDSYKDGADTKIEDVLKKLPGIVVDDKSGEITYKGKPIETVQLDGEDLFGSNYTIGTKNINADIIDKVEAIENYSSNPLLSGIESNEKVALNLVLKKKKTNLSGNGDLALGAIGKTVAADVAITLLSMSKKFKSFASSSFNNIGKNNTPFDYFSYQPGIEKMQEENFLAKKYIGDTYFNLDIDGKRSNNNNSFFGSYNSVIKINKKLSLKTIVYYLKDKIKNTENIESSYNLDGFFLKTTDRFYINKKPEQLRAETELKYNSGKNSLITYSIKYKKENIITANELIQNDVNNYINNQNSRDFFLFQILNYTKRINPNKAFQIIVKHSVSDIPQKLSFTPAIYEPDIFTTNTQESNFKKTILQIQSNLLSNTKSNKYTFSVGGSLQNIEYNSNFLGDNYFISSFQNTFSYSQKSIYSNMDYKIRINKLTFIPSINFSVRQIIFKETIKDIATKKLYFLPEPKISFNYKLNNNSAIVLSSSLLQKSFSEDYLISNPVFVSNRIVKSNLTNFSLQNIKTLSLFYYSQNIFKQQSINLNSIYSETKGNFYSDISVKENSIKYENFYLPKTNKLFAINFMIEKYISSFKGKGQFKSNYYFNQYKNILNNSVLRTNNMQGVSIELFYRSVFDGKINFENSVVYRFTQTNSLSNRSYFNSMNDKFRMKYKHSSKLFLLLSADYYLPDISYKKISYLFIDAEIKYNYEKKYTCSLSANNILNNKTFNQFTLNDFLYRNSKTTLLPRYLIFKISRGF